MSKELNTVEDYIEAYGECKTKGCKNGTPSKEASKCGCCPSWAIKAEKKGWDLR